MDVGIRRAAFKKVISEADARKARQQVVNDVRKNKQLEAQMKRRNVAMVGSEAAAPPPPPTTDAPFSMTPVKTAKPADVASLAEYVAEIMCEDADKQFHGTHEVRKLLSKERDPPVLAVLQAGILPRLVHFLATGNEKMQFEAAWAITNIASTEYTYAVVEAGGIPVLANLLRSSSPEVREQCAWCLGNITGDGASFRDMVLNTPGAVEALMLNIQYPHNESLLKNVTWTLSNFCRGKPQPALEKVQPMIPAFVHLLGATDPEILADACWGLSYLTDGDEARIQAVIDCQAVPRLIAMLANPSTNVIVPALRAIGNIVTGNDVQTQTVIDGGALPAFAVLTKHERRNIRREACWAASNVAAGTPAQVAALVSTPGVLASLLFQADKGEWNVRKEAAWAVSNAVTTGGPDVVLRVVAAGAIGPLVRLLAVDDSKILAVTLEAIGTILGTDNPSGQAHSVLVDEAGGSAALEELQKHSSKEVYNKALELLDGYYAGEEDENEGTSFPGTDEGAKTFSFGLPAAPTAFGNPFQLAAGGPAKPAFSFGFLAQQPAFTTA